MKQRFLVALVGLTLLVAGCSVEPRRGTRVVLAFQAGKVISREQVVNLSNYLKRKAEMVLGVQAPRVEKVDSSTLTLLLPGKKVTRDDVSRIIEPSSIELYHLAQVATAKHPNRPWKLRIPPSHRSPYLFLGPDARRLDSRKDAGVLLRQVVGYPVKKPVLTGSSILPNAQPLDARQGWAVQVEFNDNGSRILSDFTKRHTGEYLAVFYNGHLVSAPRISEPIPGGKALITGFVTEGQARSAVTDINAGSLPSAVKITRIEHY